MQLKLVVENVNLASKHVRGNPNLQTASRIDKRPMPIDYSNVSILNVGTSKRDKVQIKIKPNGEKVRIYRSTGQEIPSNILQKRDDNK